MIGLTKNINQSFYKVMKAHCLIKIQRASETNDLVQEMKQNKPLDPIVTKYLIQVYNDLGLYQDTSS